MVVRDSKKELLDYAIVCGNALLMEDIRSKSVKGLIIMS